MGVMCEEVSNCEREYANSVYPVCCFIDETNFEVALNFCDTLKTVGSNRNFYVVGRFVYTKESFKELVKTLNEHLKKETN